MQEENIGKQLTPEVLVVNSGSILEVREEAVGRLRAISSGDIDERDFLKLAQTVAAGLKRDGVSERFLAMKPEDQAKYAVRQAMDEMQRIRLMTNAYMTNGTVRTAFQQLIYDNLAAEVNAQAQAQEVDLENVPMA